jgi:hypothetical protein
MNKKSLKEKVLELLSDGERRTAGDIGTELGIMRHSTIEGLLMNNQNLFNFDGHGWKGLPQKQRATTDPIMQGGLDL